MMHCRWPALLFGSILVASLGTGCHKRQAATDTSPGKIMPVPEAKAESGWPLYEVPAEGFALALPPDWRRFDMNPATFEATMDEMLKKNPELKALLANLRQQLASGVKFFGFDDSTLGTGFATNVNVLRLQVPPGATLDTVVADAVRQAESLPTVVKPIHHERVKVAAGEAERFRYKVTIQTPTGQNVSLATTQFILVRGSGSYTVTAVSVSDQEAKYAETFEKIGKSFRFLK
jgi:hypothetical protein